MKNFFKKSIISTLLAITIFYAATPALSSLSIGGFSGLAETVYADTTADKETVFHAESMCGVSDIMGCVSTVLYFTTQFIHYLSTYVTWAGGEIFDASIRFSLTGQLFDASVNSMIGTGWELLRDFANLFFIFIILYIAIATILQIGTYGGKDMLVKVIVAAVLINFSLLFTSMIIDASHILAWSFYDKINVQGSVNFPDIAPAIQIIDIKKDAIAKSASVVVMAGTGLGAQLVGSYNAYSSIEGFWNALKDAGGEYVDLFTNWSVENNDGVEESPADKVIRFRQEGKVVVSSSLNDLSLLYIMSATLNFIIGFVFFAGAALFIIRVLVLWVLLIFSPLGFIAPILPKALASQASKWWDQLIKQAFFAPAFLFMFMLAAELINSDMLKASVTVAGNSIVNDVFSLSVQGTVIIIFQTMTIAFFLVLCLYVAKEMGAVGAGAAISGGKTAGNWARNKFGDKAAMRGGMYGGRRVAGLAGEGLLRAQRNADGSQNRFGKAIGTIPLVNRGFAAASSWREKQIKSEEESRKKKFGSYSDAGLTAMKGQVFTKSAGKTIEGIEKKRSAETEKKKRIDEERSEMAALRAVESDANIYKDKFSKEIEKIEEVLEGFETDLVTQNYKLAKAINDGDTTGEGLALSAIDYIKQARSKRNAEKKIREEKIKKIEKQEARRKDLEDKEERRKETEGLQGAIKSSGGGSGGSGSKNP